MKYIMRDHLNEVELLRENNDGKQVLVYRTNISTGKIKEGPGYDKDIDEDMRLSFIENVEWNQTSISV